MKEMVKSKGMVAFIIFILGVSYMSASTMNQFDSAETKEVMVVWNEQ